MMNDNSSDKTYLNEILKTIFEKPADKKHSGGKELELYVEYGIKAYKIDESLESIIELINKRIIR